MVALMNRVWRRVERLPAWILLVWTGGLLMLRSGVRGGGMDELLEFAREFPHPGPSYRSYSVLGPTIAWATGLDGENGWRLIHLTLIGVWFLVAAALLRRRLRDDRAWRIGLVWLTFLSLATSPLRYVGWYDVYTILGATLIALGGTPLLALLGGLLLGASNPEQSVFILLCGVLVSMALSEASGRERLRSVAPTFGAALAGALAARFGVMLWFNAVDATVQTRGDLLTVLLGDSVRNAATLGAAGVYTWLSMGWIVVITVLADLWDRRGRALMALTGLVVVPALVTIITTDGSRVFAAVSSVAVLLALVRFAQLADGPEGRWIVPASAGLLVFGILVPALATSYQGEFWTPWGYVVDLVVG